MIRNPILPGFNPDPSICRVGDDYYIATSTFEWFPGIQIHHSRDLENWTLIHRPLDRPEMIDMRGEPDSCGVWAPCLTWHDGLFYLTYADVKRFDGNFKDTHNYLTTCPTIDGQWSKPVYLNSSGFDPSLFHDADGRKWVLNMVWDHRPDRTRFAGIDLQEYSPERQELVGPVHHIFRGSPAGCTEGPHLYRIDGYYYLLTAEGGTGYEHAVTLARSRHITGPYELHPNVHVATARKDAAAPLQRVGHGDLVQTPGGDWYLVHLCSRMLEGRRFSPMGRETALRPLVRDSEGWFRLSTEVPAPRGALHRRQYTFENGTLHRDFQWLRTPYPERLFSLTAAPNRLRLFGRESIGSTFEQSLVARRQEHFCYQATTTLDFEPRDFQQAAGLICYYNAHKFHYLYVSFDAELGKHIGIMSCEADQSLAATFPDWKDRVPVEAGRTLHLRVRTRDSRLSFAWSYDGIDWQVIPVTLDAALLSDEAGKGEGANFTGTFVGMCCQDLTGRRLPADFSSFTYCEREPTETL